MKIIPFLGVSEWRGKDRKTYLSFLAALLSGFGFTLCVIATFGPFHLMVFTGRFVVLGKFRDIQSTRRKVTNLLFRSSLLSWRRLLFFLLRRFLSRSFSLLRCLLHLLVIIFISLDGCNLLRKIFTRLIVLLILTKCR